MKNFYLIIVLLMVFLHGMSQQPLVIGDPLEKARKKLTSAVESTYEDEITLTVPVTLNGVATERGYRFKDKKLNWIYLHNYMDELTQENFDICRQMFQSLVKENTDWFGPPDSVATGDTTFRDPYKDHHWGYDVESAFWKDAKGMKISVEFTFMGGKGEYHLLVTENCFDKDYPYWN